MDLTDAELADLYDRYAPVLYRRCYRILRDEELARDAVQETFAKVLVHADRFRRQASPLTWMYTISTNYCLNQLRNSKTRAAKLTHHRDTLAEAPEPGAPSLDHARIHALLDSCDDQTRRVVLHTYFDGCTRKEVAELVGISVPTVRKRLNGFLDLARKRWGLGATALLLLGSLPWI